ncbi:MAG: NAD(P)-dependent oxidoreductase [Verrucomicrobiota bacterium]
MKIFVTGATGFIGAAFCQRAQQRGHQIAALFNPAQARPLLGANTWWPGRLDALPLRELAEFQPEVCVHSAWISTPGEYLESPLNEQHLRWSEGLVRQLPALGVQYFVGVGTCLEYQPGDARLQEEGALTSNATAYARCKNAFRESLFTEARRAGFSACWGRVFYPYGVGEHPARLCTSLIQKFRRGEKLTLKTPNSTKDYIYIDDLAEAMLTTVEKKFQGTINWGTGEGISVRRIADAVAGILGSPELVDEVSPPQVDPLGYVVADATKLRALGWRPEVSLEAGLRRLHAAIQRSND